MESLEAALERLRWKLETRLNNYLCEMKPNYDDSITGFNEAWNVMRKLFEEERKALENKRRMEA